MNKPRLCLLQYRKYNVLDAGQGRGDELYGVEPASYYLKNLFLNTSMAFLLAVALPCLAALLYPMADKVTVNLVQSSVLLPTESADPFVFVYYHSYIGLRTTV